MYELEFVEDDPRPWQIVGPDGEIKYKLVFRDEGHARELLDNLNGVSDGSVEVAA